MNSGPDVEGAESYLGGCGPRRIYRRMHVWRQGGRGASLRAKRPGRRLLWPRGRAPAPAAGRCGVWCSSFDIYQAGFWPSKRLLRALPSFPGPSKPFLGPRRSFCDCLSPRVLHASAPEATSAFRWPFCMVVCMGWGRFRCRVFLLTL